MNPNKMFKNICILLVLLCSVVACGAVDDSVEPRGKKKKKLALFVFIADMVLKKFFVLKLIYAFIFWVVIHKAGYFLTWFISYLKEQHHHIPHHEYTPHHEYIPHHEYGPQYESYGPYRRESHKT